MPTREQAVVDQNTVPHILGENLTQLEMLYSYSTNSFSYVLLLYKATPGGVAVDSQIGN